MNRSTIRDAQRERIWQQVRIEEARERAAKQARETLLVGDRVRHTLDRLEPLIVHLEAHLEGELAAAQRAGDSVSRAPDRARRSIGCFTISIERCTRPGDERRSDGCF